MKMLLLVYAPLAFVAFSLLATWGMFELGLRWAERVPLAKRTIG